MAQRRMFSMKVVDTDAFCEMPSSAQCLYFHIGMRADDDGFYASVKGLMAKIHASQDDLNILLARRFLLDRGDGVYVIKHWKMNNYLQSDRYTPTEYQEKKIGLFTKPDGSYTLDENKAENPCIQNVYTGKDSIVKVSIDKSSKGKPKEESVKETDNGGMNKSAYAQKLLQEDLIQDRDSLIALFPDSVPEGILNLAEASMRKGEYDTNLKKFASFMEKL